jgi:hypothetical protein
LFYASAASAGYGQKTYHMVVKCSKGTQKISTFSIPRRSKIYPNWYFCFGSVPPSNPALYEEPTRRVEVRLARQESEDDVEHFLNSAIALLRHAQQQAVELILAGHLDLKLLKMKLSHVEGDGH